MKKLFIHSGFHKTGTTYIQEFLKRNRDALSAHVYYYLDDAYRDTPYANHTLAISARNADHPEIYIPESRDEVWKRFAEAITSSHSDTILISSEVFLEGVDLAFARKTLRRFESTFVFYVRRQDEYFESAYCENIKQGSSDTVKDFFEKAKSGGFDLFSQILAFEKAVPEARIIVREYNRSLFPAGDIVRDLLDAIGIELPEPEWERLEKVGAVNQRLPTEYVEIMRRFNMLPVSHAEKIAFRNYLLTLQGREPALSELPPLRVCAEIREHLLEISAESNLRLVNRYIGDGSFFSERSIDDAVKRGNQLVKR